MLGVLFSFLRARAPFHGRFWVLLTLLLRMLLLGSVASGIFEGEEFACYTQQPGCTEVCQDVVFLFSPCRFWICQIILIFTPTLLFFIYTAHQKKKKTATHDHEEDRHLRCIYVINVVFRIIIEVTFLIGQWWLYGFKVEASYTCQHRPCPYAVDCFIARAKEKTTFLCFFFAVCILSVISSLAELLQVIRYVPQGN